MQTDAFVEYIDFSDKRVMLGLSGGINSGAILCFLCTEYPAEYLPKELHLFYAHLKEHSEDTMDFVDAGVEYARKKMPSTKICYTMIFGSVNEFFREQKMIPHPSNSMCSRVLKREPMHKYFVDNNLDFDLVGYVRNEKSRIDRQKGYDNAEAKSKLYPIATMTDHDCEVLCEREIGWIPKIYKILDSRGKRVFKHNNCLPCKNMHDYEMREVKIHFPEKYDKALQTAKDTGQHWGRGDEIDELICPSCEWD